jgi:hypothetical protein
LAWLFRTLEREWRYKYSITLIKTLIYLIMMIQAVLEHDNNSTQHGWALRMRDKPTIIGEIEEKRVNIFNM